MTLTPDTLDDRAQGVHGHHPSTGQIQGEVRAGDVGDDEVEHRCQMIEQPQIGHYLRQSGGQRREDGLGPTGEYLAIRSTGSAPWPSPFRRECAQSRTASSTPLANDTRMADTRFPSASCSIGAPNRHRHHCHQRAIKLLSSLSEERRIPPEATARTTSLAVPPNTSRIRPTSLSRSSAKATRRWGEMAH